MFIALRTEFAASRKEPLAEMLDRVRAAFLAAEIGEPRFEFTLADAPFEGTASAVARVLKRFPDLAALERTEPASPGGSAQRMIVGRDGEAGGFATARAIAEGMPRAFPFHQAEFHFQAPVFGGPIALPPPQGDVPTGISVSDNWWITGRQRSMQAIAIIPADPASRKLPPLPTAVAAVYAALGKAKKTLQLPLALPAGSDIPTPSIPDQDLSAEQSAAIRAVGRDAFARMADIMARANLPHDLPPAGDARQTIAHGAATGPKKPVLDRAFRALGYECESGRGTYTLRRRTADNLTVELYLDVGTWSRSLSAIYRVLGLGIRLVIPLAVAPRALPVGQLPPMQYPIGGSDHWGQLVDNLAALVAELDKSVPPQVAAIAGPSPEWHRPPG